MSFNNLASFREYYGILIEVSDLRIQVNLDIANRQLRTWIQPLSFASIDPDIMATMTNAEANLAMYHLLLNTGIKTRVFGVGTAPTTEMTSVELMALRKQFFTDALLISAQYRVSGANPLVTTLPILREIKDIF
jgi:hypothetical protein